MRAAIAALGRIREARVRPEPGARCDLCSTPIEPDHRHVVETVARRLLCACRACALLFSSPGAGSGRYRAVPDRWVALEPFSGVLDALGVPVGVAFFFESSAAGRVLAFYPGPAGATESELPLEAWQELVAANPPLATLTPDVEALLVRATGGSFECYIVPIDACYELAGELRRTWRGFDGGAEARAALDGFFGRVRERAR